MASETEMVSSSYENREEDLKTVNTSVGAAVSEIVRTTLGPMGMDKMFVDSNGMVIITNNAKTLLGEMNINLDLLPTAKMLKEVATGQDKAAADGTTTAVVIAGELFRNAQELFEQGLHPTTVSYGYQLAAERTNAELADAATEVSLNDTDQIEKIVSTAIAGTGGAQDEGWLASLLVEAADSLRTTGDLRWDRLTVKKVSGGTVADSSLTQGIVIEGDPIHGGMPRFFESTEIACLNSNLTVEETSIEEGALEINDPDDIDRLLDREAREIKSKVKAIAENGANAVFSDKSIDERAQQMFANHDILALRRMSSSDLKHVAEATGANITEPGIIEPSDLGSATHIECQKLGNDDVVNIVTENSERASLVLRGGTEQVLDEMERAARSGFAAARALYQDDRTVPGGGAIEMRMALALREYASEVNSREQLAIEAFADALEAVLGSLAENAGLDPVDALVEARRRHATGEASAGICALDRSVTNVTSKDIVDPLAVKQQSVMTAADVVSRIIRIDDVLKAERETEIEGQ